MSILTHPQFLWALSIIASVFQVSLIIGAFINQGVSSDISTKGWSKKPAARFFISFCVGFGWGGVLAMRQGLPPQATLVVALVSSIAFTLLMSVMMRFLIKG